MNLNTPTVDVPLRKDSDGNIRIAGTRVTLDTVIGYYRQGQTPELIHKGFPTLTLMDIYAVITYYLAHEEEIDAYLLEQDQEAERRRVEWEKRFPPNEALLAKLRTAKERRDKQD